MALILVAAVTAYARETVCAGSSKDLDKHRGLSYYSLPPGKTPDDIVGMGIEGYSNYYYVWFQD